MDQTTQCSVSFPAGPQLAAYWSPTDTRSTTSKYSTSEARSIPSRWIIDGRIETSRVRACRKTETNRVQHVNNNNNNKNTNIWTIKHWNYCCCTHLRSCLSERYTENIHPITNILSHKPVLNMHGIRVRWRWNKTSSNPLKTSNADKFDELFNDIWKSE